MRPFQRALQENPAPRTLGDISLRFEPSILVGETALGRVTWRPLVLSAGGVIGTAAASVLLAVGAATTPVAACLSGAALLLWAALRLKRHETRRRRFVVNFGTSSLRLDFATPIVGRPRTIVVPFDAVCDVAVVEMIDDRWCMTVDFRFERHVLREVLAAFISTEQLSDARRLASMLSAAFAFEPGLSEERP